MAELVIWEPCGVGECGEVVVPLAYDEPSGSTVRIPVAKVDARRPDDRIGSLLINFGGPGVGATSLLGIYHESLPAVVRDRFDIVAWDPRGSGGETELGCPVPEQAGLLYDDADGFADDISLEDGRRIDWEACTDVAGLLDNINSVTAVHDMDMIRRALGEDKLNYLGYSYGTQLGWMYATLYPNAVRALALDAPVEPNMHGPEGWLRQLENFDLQLERLDALCAEAPDCRVRSEGLLATFDRLRQELAADPVSSGGTTFTEADLVASVLQGLYTVPTITGPYISAGLERLDNGQPDLLDSLTDDGGISGYATVTCADDSGIDSLADLETHIAARFERGDEFEEYPDVVLCDRWPARAIPLPAVDTSGAGPILLFANSSDPATPYAGALKLDEALAESVLVTIQSGGHGVVAGNRCADELFADYMVDLALPPVGMRCYEDGARLGLGFASGPTTDGSGVEIVRVDDGSYGAAADLLVGDVLIEVAGVAITGAGDIPLFELGSDAEFVVLRDGVEQRLIVTTLRPPWTS